MIARKEKVGGVAKWVGVGAASVVVGVALTFGVGVLYLIGLGLWKVGEWLVAL